jgi:hypothetical protein
MFSDSFRKQHSPLQNDEVRAQLRDAVLANDPARFRQILEDFSPQLASEDRWYSVITLQSDDPIRVKTIVVDRMGQRIKGDEPMRLTEMLNADIVDDHLVATIGGKTIRAYIGEMKDMNDKPNKIEP